MTLDNFLPYLLPQAKGCSEPMAIFNIRLALIEFCTEALLWREYQTPITTDGVKTVYAYTPATSQQVVKLISLTLSGNDVGVVDPTVGKSFDSRGQTSLYAYGGFRAFELRPVQAAGLPIVTYSAVAPTIDATSVPDEFSRYMQEIARGALYRLQNTKGKEYSDASASLITKAEWMDDIGEARSDAFRGFSSATPRSTPAWF